MSGADAAPQRFGTIVVVGGGCYGSYYVRQLQRASSAGAASWKRLLVVDRDADCLVTRTPRSVGSATPPIELVAADWGAFLQQYLALATADTDASREDAIVPSPLMPHLLYQWLLHRALERWPEREIVSAPLERELEVPWQRAGNDGTHYVSFADWMCPINCIEPRHCPHTRGVRDWSLTRAVPEYVAAQAERGEPLVGPVIFHCRHRAYGVGMIDTRDIVEADELIRQRAATSAATFLVGTVSHCHGALNRLVIGPPAAPHAGSTSSVD